MSLTYAKYMDAVTVRHRSISYNQLAPTGDPSVVNLKPKKLELSFSQSIEILGPYCGIRILDQLKAVVPLAAYELGSVLDIHPPLLDVVVPDSLCYAWHRAQEVDLPNLHSHHH